MMSSTEIAEMLSTNPVVVRRLLAGLRESGLMEVTKGRSGGWRVAKPLDQISMRAVFDALGQPGMSEAHETRDHPGCPVEAAVNQTLTKVEAEAAVLTLKLYEGMTLEQIASMATSSD